MVEFSLSRHPSCLPDPLTSLKVRASWQKNDLQLIFTLEGDHATLKWPATENPARTDNLWEQTCFEVFFFTQDGAYYEVNLSPSSRWAAYHFTDYRQGQSDADLPAPRIMMQPSESGPMELQSKLDLHGLAGLDPSQPLQIGLSAVIETRSGQKTYWALAHPGERPDFHHPDCFIGQIPAFKKP